MKKNKITLLSILFSLLVVGISCDKKIGKLKVDETPVTPVGSCDTITYNKHIKAIIKQNCLKCHSSPNGLGQTNLDNYALLKAKAEQGMIKAMVIDGNPKFMPLDTMDFVTSKELPKAKKDLILCWLNNGMKE